MLIVDSREKWTQTGSRDTHIKKYLEQHNILYRVEALDTGDYMLDGGCITIDRKQNLDEIAKNLLNRKDRERFMTEVRRAYQNGLQLVILIEQRGIKSLADVQCWRSIHSVYTGQAVAQRMERLCWGYGVRFEFCDPSSTAKKILQILTKNI